VERTSERPGSIPRRILGYFRAPQAAHPPMRWATSNRNPQPLAVADMVILLLYLSLTGTLL